MKHTIIVLLILAMLAIAGCQPEAASPAPPTEVPEPVVLSFEDCVDAGNPVMESYPRQCRHGDQTFTEEIEVEEPELKQGKIIGDADLPEEEPEPEGPVCGDGVCDENCADCPEDCRCGPQEECYNGECKYITCGRDYECDDDDACTRDFCQYPAHPNSFCDHEDVTKCRSGDDCCPEDCNANDDLDCDPFCGNNICEEDEGDECPEDCEDEE